MSESKVPFVVALYDRLCETAKPCHQRIVMESDLGKVQLPPDAKLVGVSEHFSFESNEIAYKFESSQFEPVKFPQRIPILRPSSPSPESGPPASPSPERQESKPEA